jgi:hypothetical protein
MYVPRGALVDPTWSRDLNQGDLLAGLLFPKPATDKTFCVRTNGTNVSASASAQDIQQPNPKLRVMLQVEVEPFVLVLSNSCDNSGGDYPVFVCPVRPFTQRAADDPGRWREINAAATGTAIAKQFYIPAHPPFQLPRSTAMLPLMRTLTHEYITRCVQEGTARRVGGLSADAVRHLQRGLDVYFARNPREDYEWPSREDLVLKAASLKADADSGRDRERAEAELSIVERKLAEE